MADTAKSLTPQQEFVSKIASPATAMYASNWQTAQNPYSGSAIDISYSPTITWQDTTSAATYSSASSVLNS